MGIFSRLLDAGQSAANFMYRDIPLGALKGLGSTVKSVANIGGAVMDKTLGTLSGSTLFEDNKKKLAPGMANIDAALKPEGVGQQLGFAGEQIGEFFLPGGVVGRATSFASKAIKGAGAIGEATKLASVAPRALSFAQRALAVGKKVVPQALSDASTSLQQTGDVKEAAMTGGITAVMGPALHLAGSVAGALAKTVSSGLSGVPVNAIEHAFKNPTKTLAAIDNAVKNGDEAVQAVFQKADDAFSELKAIRSKSYTDGLQRLADETFTTKNGVLYVKKPDAISNGKPIFVPTQLTLGGLKKEATQQLRKFGINFSDRAVDVAESKLPSSFQSSLQEVVDEVYNWKKLTPEGVDTLITRLQNLSKKGENAGERQFNSILGSLTTNLNGYIAKKVPQIGELRTGYATQSKVIDDIRAELFNGKESMTVRKLMSVFNPKQPIYKRVVAELGDSTAKDLMSDIAGSIFSQWTPDGLGKYLTTAAGTAAAMGAPGVLAALPAASPRIVGTVAAAAGKSFPVISGAARAIAPGVSGLLGKIGGAAAGTDDTRQQPTPQQPVAYPKSDALKASQPDKYQQFVDAVVSQGGTEEQAKAYLETQNLP